MHRRPLTAVVLLTGAAVVAAQAQPGAGGGDAREGHRLALEICDSCHVVAPDQQFPPLLRNPAPSFQTIADSPGTTAASLRTFVLTTHATIAAPANMPNPQLTEDEATALSAYILSLRRSTAPPKR